MLSSAVFFFPARKTWAERSETSRAVSVDSSQGSRALRHEAITFGSVEVISDTPSGGAIRALIFSPIALRTHIDRAHGEPIPGGIGESSASLRANAPGESNAAARPFPALTVTSFF